MERVPNYGFCLEATVAVDGGPEDMERDTDNLCRPMFEGNL